MARTPNIDTEKLKAQSLQLRDAAAVHAGRIAVRAADLAEQGLHWQAQSSAPPPSSSPQLIAHRPSLIAHSPSYPIFTVMSSTTTCLASTVQ